MLSLSGNLELWTTLLNRKKRQRRIIFCDC